MEKRIIRLQKAKSGLPVAWETGGRIADTGTAVIVAGVQGEALRPCYVRPKTGREGHASFIVRVGMHLIKASHYKESFVIRIFRITGLRREDDHYEADIEAVASYEEGEWDVNPGSLGAYMDSAVEAAKRKALTPNCKSAIYFTTK